MAFDLKIAPPILLISHDAIGARQAHCVCAPAQGRISPVPECFDRPGTESGSGNMAP